MCKSLLNFAKVLVNLIYKIIIKINELSMHIFMQQLWTFLLFRFFIVFKFKFQSISRIKLRGNMCTVQHRWRKEETAIEQKHKLWLLLCIIVTVKHECIVAIFRRKYHHICKYILIFFSFLKSSSPVTAYLCKYIVGQLILLRLRAREGFFYANAQRWVTKKNYWMFRIE